MSLLFCPILKSHKKLGPILKFSQKNIISLGASNSNGCKFSVEGGVMKTVKGALNLIKDKRIENLHVLSEYRVIVGAVLSSARDHYSVSMHF